MATTARVYPIPAVFTPEQENALEGMLKFILDQIESSSSLSVAPPDDGGDTIIVQDQGPINGRTIGITTPAAGRFSQLYLSTEITENITVPTGQALVVAGECVINGSLTLNGQLNII